METVRLDNSVSQKTIAIIGAGHIGSAIIQGLVQSDNQNASRIIATNTEKEPLEKLQKQFGIAITQSNREAVKKADWVILCVKPFVVKEVLEDIRDLLQRKLLISVAAGATLTALEKYSISSTQKIIRIMPNMPIAYNKGVIGFLANDNVKVQEKEEVQQYFSQLGNVYPVTSEEAFIFFSLTPGCGPALASYCIDMFAKSAREYGLHDDISEQIAKEIFEGTLTYLQNTKQKPKELMEKVATKGGVTEQILSSLGEKKFSEQFIESIQKGFEKVKEIEYKLKEVNTQ